MTYDNEGRFRPQNFEDIFAKYDRDNKGGLSVSDVKDFIRGQSMVLDLFGINATILECKYNLIALRALLTRCTGTAVYLLLWPEDGIMRKEDVRGIYDGSIFYKKADEYAIKTGKKPQPKVKKLM